MTTTFSLKNSINGAKYLTARVANLKDYKVRTKRLRALRELARELTTGKGYIIATCNELNQRYGYLMTDSMSTEDNDKKHVWHLNYLKPYYSDRPKVCIFFSMSY